MKERKAITVGMLALAIVVVLLLLTMWASQERARQACTWRSPALHLPLLMQACRQACSARAPVSFVLDELDCAQKLAEHLKIEGVRVVPIGRKDMSGMAGSVGAFPLNRTPSNS